MRPGIVRAAAFTSAGSRTAAVPMMTRLTPLSSHASIVARSRMPPPSCSGYSHRGEDALDGSGVHRLAGESAVEIDDVQVFKSLVLEKARLSHWVRTRIQ